MEQIGRPGASENSIEQQRPVSSCVGCTSNMLLPYGTPAVVLAVLYLASSAVCCSVGCMRFMHQVHADGGGAAVPALCSGRPAELQAGKPHAALRLSCQHRCGHSCDLAARVWDPVSYMIALIALLRCWRITLTLACCLGRWQFILSLARIQNSRTLCGCNSMNLWPPDYHFEGSSSTCVARSGAVVVPPVVELVLCCRLCTIPLLA